MQRIPEPLKNLVDQLARLPGLGPKSAMRAAMTLLKWPEAEVRRLGKGVYELRDTLHLCSRCGGLSDSDPCPICSDPGRDAAKHFSKLEKFGKEVGMGAVVCMVRESSPLTRECKLIPAASL